MSLRNASRVVPVLVLLGVAVVMLPGKSLATDPFAAAQQVCKAELGAVSDQFGPIDAIERAESDDVATIVAWQEAKIATMLTWTSPLREIDQASVWTVCLYHGQFSTPTTPSLDGTPTPPHDTIRVLVSGAGQITLDSAGYAGRMAPETPRDWLLTRGG